MAARLSIHPILLIGLALYPLLESVVSSRSHSAAESKDLEGGSSSLSVMTSYVMSFAVDASEELESYTLGLWGVNPTYTG